MDKKCIVIPSYVKPSTGSTVREHIRCFDRKKLTEAELSKIEEYRDRIDRVNLTDEELEKLGLLKDEERTSLRFYTKRGYQEINDCLRHDFNCNDFIDKNIDIISSFLESEETFSGTTYRGMVLDDSELRELIVAYENGFRLEDRGFLSTSENIDIAKEFTFDRARAGKKVLFRINGRSGVDISEFSNAPSEQEILFDLDSEFDIESYTEDGDLSIFDLTEL